MGILDLPNGNEPKAAVKAFGIWVGIKEDGRAFVQSRFFKKMLHQFFTKAFANEFRYNKKVVQLEGLRVGHENRIISYGYTFRNQLIGFGVGNIFRCDRKERIPFLKLFLRVAPIGF